MRPLFWLATALVPVVLAEDGMDGWLRYAPLPDKIAKCHAKTIPSQVTVLGATDGRPLASAVKELKLGLRGIFGKEVDISSEGCIGGETPSILLSTLENYVSVCGELDETPELEEDGFYFNTKDGNVVILGSNERATLYGTFEYLSRLAQARFDPVEYVDNPEANIRWGNHWDNMDYTSSTHGSIERGYAGVSIFFKDNKIRDDLSRVEQYARLLSSVRINAIVINNVNANPITLTDENLEGVGRIADLFRPYGVQVALSLNFASPVELGDLDTFDPLDEDVVRWWDDMVDKIYDVVPDLAGFLNKANSEGQPGPLTYNRTLAEGANLMARPAARHGGIFMFRAFVYDHHLDHRDWYNDRANAAVEFFKHLDGAFEDNVVIQIKYGPIDFQVREPPSTLFAHMPRTPVAIELQVTQEYLGQQNHLFYMTPLWRDILDFDLRVDGETSYVRDVVSGKRFGHKLGGYAAVINVGMDRNWLGSHLAMSNLYAYGRIAWDASSDPVDVVEDWTRLTFGLDGPLIDTITDMSMLSWPMYENYTGNLGIQTLTDILHTHYGPNPASQDNNGWGQWTRANRYSIGMDRTVWNGTGFAGQYPAEVAERFEHIETTPDNLLLWFHHVPYTHVLKSGKTVIQHFYDAHYDGAEAAQTLVPMWESLQGYVDEERYEHVLHRLVYQAGHAIVWRDAINYFYHNLSGIEDEAGRVGSHPWRIEVEDMELDGYETVAVTPPATASRFHAVQAVANATKATATTTLDFPAGTYRLAVNYYDLPDGQASYEVLINGDVVAAWEGDYDLFLGNDKSEFLDGHSAARRWLGEVSIAEGDELKIVGRPDGIERAPLDYVVFLPEGVVD